jgi:hypothetical protein
MAMMFRPCRTHVAEMMSAGAPLEHVAEHIEAMPLGEDEKAALWLYARAGGMRGARDQSIFSDRAVLA